MKGSWRIALRATVTLSIIAYLSYKLDWRQLAAQMARVDYLWLGAACLLFGLTYLLAALRWWLLLRVQNIRLPLKAVTALTLIGQLFNTFMLGSVGGDIVKAVYLHRYAPRQRTHATLSVVMDRGLGLFVLLSCSLLAIPSQISSMATSDKLNTAILGLLALFGIIVIGVIATILLPFHRAPPRLRELWRKVPHHQVIELLLSGFRQHAVARKLTLASVATGMALALVLNLAGYCIATGIGLNVQFMQLLVIITVAVCVISLPISIGGHGVREGIFVLMFAAFGIVSADGITGAGQEAAILFSLLFFAVPLVWALVGGVIYLTYRHDYPTALPQHLPGTPSRRLE